MALYSIGPARQADTEFFLRLYEESFPPEERRIYSSAADFDTFRRENSDFHVLIARDETDAPVAFLSYWTFCGICYGEHFAVLPDLRGAGLGSMMLEHLKSLPEGAKILLEVELPDNEIARRRIAFYERHGFRLRPEIDYLQPSYGPGLDPIPLLLMTAGDVRLADSDILPTLRRKVYRCP